MQPDAECWTFAHARGDRVLVIERGHAEARAGENAVAVCADDAKRRTPRDTEVVSVHDQAAHGDEIESRHTAYFLQLAREAEPHLQGPNQAEWLKRLEPAVFQKDLVTLFDLLKEGKIKPLIARRFPLAEAKEAHELLGKGGVTGKIVLVANQPRA